MIGAVISRRWLAGLCALACAGGALALAGGASASSPLQGNPQGIKLAQRSLAAFDRLPALSYSQRGFFQVNVRPGKNPNVSYYYGYGALHPGYAWAAEHGTVALHDGDVVWWRDDLAPLSGHGSPVELVANSEGVFSALGNAAHHSCFDRVVGTVPYSYGGSAYSIAARYKNGTSPLRSVYRWWETGQRAHETDTLASGSGLVTSGTVRVAPGAGLAGFEIAFTNAYPGSPGAAPKIKLCR